MENDQPIDRQADVAEEEPHYFLYSATLRIFGTIPDPGDITRSLGLEPTHFHRRGERRSPLADPWKHDMWSYQAPIERTEPLSVHIDVLWAAIREHKSYLLGLKSDAVTVDVFVGYRSNSDTAGVEVPYQSLEMFIELQVPFGLSIIIV